MSEKDTKKERREQILIAAGKLFSHHGLKKTSMDDIAEAVGLVKTSLYYYFDKKEKIFESVIHRESEMLIAQLKAEINKHTSPHHKLRVYFITRMEHLKELGNLYQITKSAARELLLLAEGERQQFLQAEKALVLNILEDGINSETFKMSDPEFIAIVILASMRGLESTLLMYQDKQLKAADYEAMLNVLFNGILKK